MLDILQTVKGGHTWIYDRSPIPNYQVVYYPFGTALLFWGQICWLCWLNAASAHCMQFQKGQWMYVQYQIELSVQIDSWPKWSTKLMYAGWKQYILHDVI